MGFCRPACSARVGIGNSHGESARPYRYLDELPTYSTDSVVCVGGAGVLRAGYI